jgi:hypothetical protein
MMQAFVLDRYTWSSEIESDDQIITIKVRCFGVCFEIQYLPHNLAASPHLLEQHEKSLCILRTGDQGNSIKVENGIEEIRRLQKPFEALMTKLAPNPPPPANYLFDYLYTKYLVLEAMATTQDSTTIQTHFKGSHPRQVFWRPGQYLSGWSDRLGSVKRFTSRQVRLVPTSPDPEHHPCLRGPSKVIAEDGADAGTVCYFKGFESWHVRRVGLDEPWVYKRIAAALETKRLSPEIRICRLHGIVVDDDHDVLQHFVRAPKEDLAKWDEGFESESESESSPSMSASMSDAHPDLIKPQGRESKRIVGILLTYIENKGTLSEVAPWSDCPNEHRHRWAAELQVLIRELHAAGLVWGDAKPHNVLVDRENRLWLIDFDGSYTYGWVDEDKKETQEGDLQGVKRIQEWLVKCCKGPINRKVPRDN